MIGNEHKSGLRALSLPREILLHLHGGQSDHCNSSLFVQIMRNERVKFDAAGRPLEAVLLGDRQHAGLVRVIGYAVLTGGHTQSEAA